MGACVSSAHVHQAALFRPQLERASHRAYSLNSLGVLDRASDGASGPVQPAKSCRRVSLRLKRSMTKCESGSHIEGDGVQDASEANSKTGLNDKQSREHIA